MSSRTPEPLFEQTLFWGMLRTQEPLFTSNTAIYIDFRGVNGFCVRAEQQVYASPYYRADYKDGGAVLLMLIPDQH